MRKKSIFLLLAVLLLLTSCTGNVKNTIGVKAGDASGLTLEKKSSFFEYYTDSPDKKNAILEKIDIIPPSKTSYTRTTELYLNDTGKPLEEKNYHVRDTENYRHTDVAQWIDNDRLLLKGDCIYNINTKEKKYIDFADLMEKGTWLTNFALSPDKKGIAYITFSPATYDEKLQSSVITETVYYYEIETENYDLLYQNRFKITDTESMTAEASIVFWNEDGNIVFSEWAESLKPYMLRTVDMKTKEITEVEFPERILSDYDNGKYVIVSSEDGKTKVMETKTRKELYSSDNAILSAISDGKLFLYEGDRTMSDMKYMTKNAKISVISLSNGKVLKEISLNDYESLDAYYSTIRDGKVYFNINKNIYSLAL